MNKAIVLLFIIILSSVCIAEEKPNLDTITNNPSILTEVQLNMEGVLEKIDPAKLTPNQLLLDRVLKRIDQSKLTEYQLNSNGIIDKIDIAKLTKEQLTYDGILSLVDQSKITKEQLKMEGVLDKVEDLTKLNLENLAKATGLNQIEVGEDFKGLKYENGIFLYPNGGSIHKSMLREKNVIFDSNGVTIKNSAGKVDRIYQKNFLNMGAIIGEQKENYNVIEFDNPRYKGARVILTRDVVGNINIEDGNLLVGKYEFGGFSRSSAITFDPNIENPGSVRATNIKSVLIENMEIFNQDERELINVEVINRKTSRGVVVLDNSNVNVFDKFNNIDLFTKLKGKNIDGEIDSKKSKYVVYSKGTDTIIGFEGSGYQQLDYGETYDSIYSNTGAKSTYKNNKISSMLIGTESNTDKKIFSYHKTEKTDTGFKTMYSLSSESKDKGVKISFDEDEFKKQDSKYASIYLKENIIDTKIEFGRYYLEPETKVMQLEIQSRSLGDDQKINYKSDGNEVQFSKSSLKSGIGFNVIKGTPYDGLPTLYKTDKDTILFSKDGVYSEKRNSKIVPLRPLSKEELKGSFTYQPRSKDGLVDVRVIGISEKIAKSAKGTSDRMSISDTTKFMLDLNSKETSKIAEISIDKEYRDIINQNVDSIGNRYNCGAFAYTALSNSCSNIIPFTTNRNAWTLEHMTIEKGGVTKWSKNSVDDIGIDKLTSQDKVSPGDLITFWNKNSNYKVKSEKQYESYLNINNIDKKDSVYSLGGNNAKNPNVPTHVGVIVTATETLHDGTERKVPYVFHQFGKTNRLQPLRDVSKDGLTPISIFSMKSK